MGRGNKFLVPGAILVAGILLAGAFFVAGRDDGRGTPREGENGVSMRPVTSQDRIKGNPDAPIKIVEFSDIDCPFCADFHITMNRILEEFGPSGQVAWVYRHFPIAQIHPQAKTKAEASECVADIGGDDAFWRYLDILFERETPVSGLAQAAQEVGVSRSQFDACLSEGRFRAKVEADIREAQDLGIRGTPHSIILIEETGEEIPLSGAHPYSSVRQIVEILISDLTDLHTGQGEVTNDLPNNNDLDEETEDENEE